MFSQIQRAVFPTISAFYPNLYHRQTYVNHWSTLLKEVIDTPHYSIQVVKSLSNSQTRVN